MYEYTGQLQDFELQLKIDEMIKRIKHSKECEDAYREFNHITDNYCQKPNRETVYEMFDWLDEGAGYTFQFITEDEIKRNPVNILHNIILGAF